LAAWRTHSTAAGLRLLVPPADLDALVGAVLRVAGDKALRNRIVSEGLRVARTLTLESEAERVARFINVQARVSPPHEL
jgi:glycosyltransferase involved in cell wall biosynthesis